MPKIEGIRACVFDAYGTLFDVAAAARQCQDELGEKWAPLAQTWRDKQLQYTWLLSLMNAYVPFWQITQDSLDFAMESLDLNSADLRRRLLDIYFHIDAYPEVPDVIRKLNMNGVKTAILSNGSPDMLDAAVTNADFDLDEVLSVDPLKVYKPDPRVYQMAVDELTVDAHGICFMSSNAWDAWGASHFGFQVVWVNRFDQPPERLPGGPAVVLKDLSGLPVVLGLA